jgi:hypothetical protein
VLLPVFGAIWLFDRKGGGHQAENISAKG